MTETCQSRQICRIPGKKWVSGRLQEAGRKAFRNSVGRFSNGIHQNVIAHLQINNPIDSNKAV